jgi:HK97 gp10 family phage protein
MPQAASANRELAAEIERLKKKLYAISDNAKKESQQAFKEAAPILISAIQARAPQSEKPHYRYSTPKVAGNLRAPNGMGKIVATYMPGNLKRSFKTLVFRRSASIYVGPKLDKQGSGGTFTGNRTDGYYAHWQEFGAPEAGVPPQPFVKPAVSAAGDTTLRLATELLKRKIERTATR